MELETALRRFCQVGCKVHLWKRVPATLSILCIVGLIIYGMFGCKVADLSLRVKDADLLHGASSAALTNAVVAPRGK